MRILEGRAAERAVLALESRATRLEELEPRVRTIIRAVRRDGDKALRRYATLWDGLQKAQPIRVSDEEIAAAWQSTPAETCRALRQAAARIRKFCQWQMPREWRKRQSRQHAGTNRATAGRCGLLCTRRPLPASFHVPDDRHPRAGRRRAANLRGIAASATGDSGRRRAAGNSAKFIAAEEPKRSRLWLTEPSRCRKWTRSSGRETAS